MSAQHSIYRSILDVPMTCQKCGWTTRAGDCIPDVDGEGSLGCPRIRRGKECRGICTGLGDPHDRSGNVTTNTK